MLVNTNNYSAKDIIKFIRQNADLTQKQFGEKINKKEETIKRYENGTRNYDFKLLIEIAEKFNLKITIKENNNKFTINVNNNPDEVFKIIRNKLKLTIVDFSKILKKDISTITRYSNGSINYNFILLIDIAKKFNFNIIIEDNKKNSL